MIQTNNEGPGLKVGDTIKCHDAEDMIATSAALAKEGIQTDFLYEKSGEKGLWLEVVGHDENRLI